MVVDESSTRFQKPNKYLKFLPHTEHLDEDADQFLELVKDKLSASVLLLDIKHGAKYWTQQLMRFAF